MNDDTMVGAAEWAAVHEAFRSIRELAYTLTRPEIESDINPLELQATLIAADSDSATIVRWNLDDYVQDDTSLLNTIHGTVADVERRLFYLMGGPIPVITVWAASEAFTGTVGGTLVTGWVNVTDRLVPSLSVLVGSDGGMRMQPNRRFDDPAPVAEQLLTALKIAVGLSSDAADVVVPAAMRRNAAKLGTVLSVRG